MRGKERCDDSPGTYAYGDSSLTKIGVIPVNRSCGKWSPIVMTHNRKGSIAAFSISKSVEPNEEQKVLISDSEQEITASTER